MAHWHHVSQMMRLCFSWWHFSEFVLYGAKESMVNPEANGYLNEEDGMQNRAAQSKNRILPLTCHG